MSGSVRNPPPLFLRSRVWLLSMSSRVPCLPVDVWECIGEHAQNSCSVEVRGVNRHTRDGFDRALWLSHAARYVALMSAFPRCRVGVDGGPRTCRLLRYLCNDGNGDESPFLPEPRYVCARCGAPCRVLGAGDRHWCVTRVQLMTRIFGGPLALVVLCFLVRTRG